MIVVCDNTDIADHFYRAISGEELIKADVPDDEDEDDDDAPKKRKKQKAKSITARDCRASRNCGIAKMPR